MSSLSLAESTGAKARIGEIRARFALEQSRLDGPSALGIGVATHFEAAAGCYASTHFRAVFPITAKRSVARRASVELPMRADGESHLEDATSRVSVKFRLRGATPSPAAVADGYALYIGALDGADVVHRVHAEGTEDYVVFETRPVREELHYDVDVARVPGLRLVSNTLEFLDQGGSPALRVAPPYVVDAHGARHDAKLAVSGCTVDASVAAPWGRPVTKPDADRCMVHVTWSGVAYPAMVDPAWGATGSMAAARSRHTASVLASGRVLVAGGLALVTRDDPRNGTSRFKQYLASAELFDPDANGVGAFAATGAMATERGYHTASVLRSGKVLVVGGYTGHQPEFPPPAEVVASAELFDPELGAFAATGGMAAARVHHTASVLSSGKVLIAGSVARAELFDPAANGGLGAFAPTGAMVTPPYGGYGGHTASVLPSGKVLLAGGDAGANAELFDPTANGGEGAFTPTGAMATVRRGHTASVLRSGKVLVTGGSHAQDEGELRLASAELFDPTANGGAGAFAPAGAMGIARTEHTASVLASDNILVVGGANTELLEPSMSGSTFNSHTAGSMATARYYDHTATMLASGKVLVAGGIGDPFRTFDDPPLASVEVFGGAPGEACTSGGYCVSGFCDKGFCGCGRCELPGPERTCTIAPLGNPGANPPCAFPFACDGVSAMCPTYCTSDAACAPAYSCAADGTCQARTCDLDHTTTGASGSTQDCAPYKCDLNGSCRKQCTSVGDCVAPTVCDTSHQCVTPRQESADSGCGIAAKSVDAAPVAWLFGMTLLAARRRHRTRARSRHRR